MLAIGIWVACIVAGLLSGHISIDMARQGYHFRDGVSMFGSAVFGVFGLFATFGGVAAIIYNLLN